MYTKVLKKNKEYATIRMSQDKNKKAKQTENQSEIQVTILVELNGSF